VGHILLACNNDEVVLNVELPALLQQFNDLMNRDGMIEFMFAEDKEFSEYFEANPRPLTSKRSRIIQVDVYFSVLCP
jgi:hypothetical protein